MRAPPLQAAVPFGFIDRDDGTHACVPVVAFDYESVFTRMDGEVTESPKPPSRPPLTELLSPRELQHALAVARAILKRNSPLSRSTRASWRNPEIRARRMAGIRRSWQNRDRQYIRDEMVKRWRDHRPEIMAKLMVALRKPEYIKLATENTRRMWANPEYRQKLLSLHRSPEARKCASINTRSFFQKHPEARQKAGEWMRARWRNPAYRAKQMRTRAANRASLSNKANCPHNWCHAEAPASGNIFPVGRSDSN
jgi:hypothetical protein